MSNTAAMEAAVVPEMTVGELRVLLRLHQIEGRSAADAASAFVRDMLTGWFEPERE